MASRMLAIDASGTFVYTANFADDDLSVLKIAAAAVAVVAAHTVVAMAEAVTAKTIRS